MNRHNRSGYILILTLMIISVCVTIVTYLTTKSMVYSSLVRIMNEREKARQLAHAGIQLAFSQLSVTADEKEENKETPAPPEQKTPGAPGGPPQSSPAQDSKTLLTTLLPNLNTVQTFVLKQKIDGIDGTVAFAISSEEGKININALFDFEKQKFLNEGAPEGDAKKFMQEVFAKIKEKTGGNNLFEPLQKFLKQRQYKLNEVTELLTIPGFEVFKESIWFAPQEKSVAKQLALTDIFTLHSQEQGIDPWLLSPSVRQALSISGKEEKNTAINEALKNFKVNTVWQKDWDASLGALYGIPFTNLGKIIPSFLSTKFEPKIFSVVSYGTVGKTTYTLFAIIERMKDMRDKKTVIKMRIIKLYVV